MATDRYNAAEAEAKWQKIWDRRGINATADQRRSLLSKPRLVCCENPAIVG
jgi:leucyl-tRNA synthetase